MKERNRILRSLFMGEKYFAFNTVI